MLARLEGHRDTIFSVPLALGSPQRLVLDLELLQGAPSARVELPEPAVKRPSVAAVAPDRVRPLVDAATLEPAVAVPDGSSVDATVSESPPGPIDRTETLDPFGR